MLTYLPCVAGAGRARRRHRLSRLYLPSLRSQLSRSQTTVSSVISCALRLTLLPGHGAGETCVCRDCGEAGPRSDPSDGDGNRCVGSEGGEGVQSGAESWTGSGLNIWHTTTSPSPVRDRETGAKKSIGTNIRILKTNDLKSSN